MKPHLTQRSACVVIERDGKFACIRARKHGGGVGLPGGKSNIGETAVQTAMRECFEEIGVTPVNLKRFYVRDVDGFECVLFAAEIPEGAVLVSSEEGEAFWCSREELLSHDGTYREHTAEWLPLYDALLGKL